jgi:hypothetical protein
MSIDPDALNDALDQQDAAGEPEEAAPTADYTVQTGSAEIEFADVAEIRMGEAGELWVADAAGGCLGLFAPGGWRHIRAIIA